MHSSRPTTCIATETSPKSTQSAKSWMVAHVYRAFFSVILQPGSHVQEVQLPECRVLLSAGHGRCILIFFFLRQLPTSSKLVPFLFLLETLFLTNIPDPNLRLVLRESVAQVQCARSKKIRPGIPLLSYNKIKKAGADKHKLFQTGGGSLSLHHAQDSFLMLKV